MNRRYILRDKEILTPEAVRAILAKELLTKASKPEPSRGSLISAGGHRFYVFISTQATDSADQQPHDDDSGIMTMLASEAVLRREWDTPEEDEAWEDLLRVR